MSFSPVYKGHHLEKVKMEIHTVSILFKKLQFPQVYHIYRYSLSLSRKTKAVHQNRNFEFYLLVNLVIGSILI